MDRTEDTRQDVELTGSGTDVIAELARHAGGR